MSETNEGRHEGEPPLEPADERPTEPIAREHRHATRPIPPVPQAPTVPGASASPYGTHQSPYGQGQFGQSPYSQGPYSEGPYSESPYSQQNAYSQNPYGPGAPQQYPPSYGYQQPQYPQPYSYAQPEPRTLSIVSMVCGIASLLGFGFLLLPQLAAIVLGHLALSREPAGRGFAIAGLATGYFCLLVSVVVIAFLVIGIASISQYSYNY
ncbi:DUF4190 domain-containing protein [Sinomonas humi]|uniref:DUF4190 domain-containing protein n=1 Tax=Sinomonas humi TaxID=1338436 RepID=A0A0B2ALN6_9MICC|nr:DUF4190 domain-containing protein [Sinomonas humi]KHL02774.1 hypothetical protein LK10_11440 [Sinomonas humi]